MLRRQRVNTVTNVVELLNFVEDRNRRHRQGHRFLKTRKRKLQVGRLKTWEEGSGVQSRTL